ncbi:MAG: type 1 glutamine amidotransferase [Gammaproteobacteria bacterium]|nr:MAG: type 1 glutamine amidotransferase [Gammaproteobacteria bacterium]
MKPLRIFHHQLCEPPAYLCSYLEHRGLPFEVICIHEKQSVPDALDDISGLIFMGGQGSVNDDKDWITRELALIRRADRQNIPILGVCFGAQLISKSLGGSVQPAESMEIGWHAIKAVREKTDNEKVGVQSKNRWSVVLPTNFHAFQWHAHTFTVPAGATRLWRSHCCEQQGFVRGRVLAMQFHLEVTADSIMALSRQYAIDLSHTSACVQNAAQLTENLLERTDRLHQVADQVYECWLKNAELV